MNDYRTNQVMAQMGQTTSIDALLAEMGSEEAAYPIRARMAPALMVTTNAMRNFFIGSPRKSITP
jgi:hypothetical protein